MTSNISRFLCALGALLGLLSAQAIHASQPFQFEYTGTVAPNCAVFVVGDLQELGANDVRYAVKLESHLAPIWRISVELPPGKLFHYQYVLRETAPGRLGDRSNSVALTSVQTATTPDGAFESNAKAFYAKLDTPNPVVKYRPKGAASAPYSTQVMSRVGPGRAGTEATYVAFGLGAPDDPIDFYFADTYSAFRDPAVGTYTSSLSTLYVQDGRIFTYEPYGAAASEGDISNRPFQVYWTMYGDQPQWVPALDRGNLPYRSMTLLHDPWFGNNPFQGPHMIMRAPGGKEAYMQAHLAKVSLDVLAFMPDPSYDGLVVIDYEHWWPFWTMHPNFPSPLAFDAMDQDWIDDWRDYIREFEPQRLVGLAPAQQEEVFRTTWLAITREYIERTIRLVKQMRPNAKVCLYDMPGQRYWEWTYPDLAARLRTMNDEELGWYYDLADVLAVGMYTFYRSIPGDGVPPEDCDWEPQCLQYYNNVMTEALRVCRGKPIYVFLMPFYHDSNLTWPRMPVNDFNLTNMFEVPYQRGASGVVLFGFMYTQSDFDMWAPFFHDRFTPFMQQFFQRPRVMAGVNAPVGGQPGAVTRMVGPSPARRDYLPTAPPTIVSAIQGGATRSYRVVLPRGYDEHTFRRYPVVFFQDGQSMFDSLRTGETWNALPGLLEAVESGEAREAILVGVDYGSNVLEFVPPDSGGQADQYLAFVRDELFPVIYTRYRVLHGSFAHGVIGAGAGAQAAFYMAWSDPGSFQRVAALSAGWNSSLNGFHHRVLSESGRSLRVYLDSGDTSAEANSYNLTLSLRDNLAAKPNFPLVTDRDLKWLVGFGQSSSAGDLSARLPGAYTFLYPASEESAQLRGFLDNRLDLDFSGGISIEDLAMHQSNRRDLNADGIIDAADGRLLESALRAGELRDMARRQR